MRTSYLKRINYINWKTESNEINITIDQMNSKLALLQDIKPSELKTARYGFTYRIEIRGYWKYLYVFEGPGKYNVYTCNMYNDAANTGKTSKSSAHIGAKAQQAENALFKEINGVSERAAFGYCDRALIHYCVPKQLYYINIFNKHQKLHHVSKADYSSHYPDAMCGKLPTWQGHKIVEGSVKPNEKYPFAFYVYSHMCAEYGKFDMHDWREHDLWHDLFRAEDWDLNVPDDEEVTILCKASKYELTSTEQKLYEYKLRGEQIKGIDPKIVLNSAIGYKHLKNLESTKCRLDHIAAITIARANQQMIELIDEIGYRNILQVVVDGIIYKGKYEIGVHEKKLGALIQEHTDCDFIMRGTNQYMLFKDGECVDIKSSGFDENIVCNELDDIYKWSKRNGKDEKQ